MRKWFLVLPGILLLGVILMSGCKPNLAAAEDGNTVKVDYTGKLTDGTVFDSSVGKEPLEFTVGAGQMIPGFDKAVVGMKVGDKKTVTIPADEAYGQRNDNLVQVVSRGDLPEGLTPKIGLKLQAMDQAGGVHTFTITAITDTSVTVDGNHELAGKDLIFEITMVSITIK